MSSRRRHAKLNTRTDKTKSAQTNCMQCNSAKWASQNITPCLAPVPDLLLYLTSLKYAAFGDLHSEMWGVAGRRKRTRILLANRLVARAARREGSDAKRPAAKKAEVGDRRAAARSSSRIAHAWPTAKQTLSSSCKRPTWAVAAERQDVGSGPNAKTWAVAAMQSPNANFDNFDSLRLA